ncbi:hypothetical protein HD554DRAFT_2312089 [Boletus coccyginus]|nr:hypothetical protein HD554DRAFT_2312089 [Boletus coccyginus]
MTKLPTAWEPWVTGNLPMFDIPLSATICHTHQIRETNLRTVPLVAPYLLSLCKVVENSDFSFGVVSRLGTQSSTFQLDAAKLIHSIVEHSPASESVALEFLREFQKISGIYNLVGTVVRLRSTLEPEQWAQEILEFLREREPDEVKAELKPTLDLATKYLNHLLVATRNPGGKKTPQESTPPTPDIDRLHSIEELLDDATINRKQSALKTLVYRRDGYRCPLTGYSFKSPGRRVNPRCAHILPFSFHDKVCRGQMLWCSPFSKICQPVTLRTLEAFTGHAITANVVCEKINHPSNAFNAQNDAHESFDQLTWGIEALQQPGGEYKYIFREVRNRCAATVRLEDGDEIVFRKGENGQMIDSPDPSFCNLKLAIARVMYASGASDLIDEIYGDDDDDEAIVNLPVYLGGPFISDDTLFRRLYDRLP